MTIKMKPLPHEQLTAALASSWIRSPGVSEGLGNFAAGSLRPTAAEAGGGWHI